MSALPLAPRMLGLLLDELQAARHDVATQRGIGSATQPDLTSARSRLLEALEGYVDALEAAGVPVPYRLRDELSLCRRTTRRGAY